MYNVLIIYRFLPHYRKEFYEGLKTDLAEKGVNLDLVYGRTNKKDALKDDEVEITWAKKIKNRYLRIGKVELLWQPCLSDLKGKDLIIVEQANKLIINYYLMISRHFTKMKLGVWGHGRNMQIKSQSIFNKFKNLFLKQSDGYFAYTKGVKEFIAERGYPEDKIHVVQNAIDTRALRAQFNAISDQEVKNAKREMGIDSKNIGIFCGGMYAEKRLDFLLDTCNKIKDQVPDFEMIFIGSGVDSDIVKQAADNVEWIHYLGPKLGNERVLYFKIASLQLMPGLVGLAVLDSFIFETPLITTDYPYHSPEIEYLENDVNGCITENSEEAFVDETIRILKSGQLKQLIEGCKASATKYTMQNMIQNFSDGIMKMLPASNN